jgi:hypothetical protein
MRRSAVASAPVAQILGQEEQISGSLKDQEEHSRELYLYMKLFMHWTPFQEYTKACVTKVREAQKRRLVLQPFGKSIDSDMADETDKAEESDEPLHMASSGSVKHQITWTSKFGE